MHFWHYVGKANVHLRNVDFFNFRRMFYHFQQFIYNFSKNPTPLKHILALLTKGQICTDSVLQPFTYHNFQSEQPYNKFITKKQTYDISNYWFDICVVIIDLDIFPWFQLQNQTTS